MKTFQSHHYNFMILFSGSCQDGLYVLSLLTGGIFPIRYLHSYLRFWRLIILCTFLFLQNSSWISMKKPGRRKASFADPIYKSDPKIRSVNIFVLYYEIYWTDFPFFMELKYFHSRPNLVNVDWWIIYFKNTSIIQTKFF